jgi:hypothetical protein
MQSALILVNTNIRSPPWQDDPGSHVRSAEGLLEVLDAAHLKLLVRLREILEEDG